MVVGSHCSDIDAIVFFYHSAPAFVAHDGVAKMPLIGTVAQALGCIFVDRFSPASRHQTKERIKEHCESYGERHHTPLLIYPEGWVTNGEALVSFATGAFDPGAPVVPTALVYPSENLQITTSPMNWGGDGLFIFRLMFQVYNYAHVSFLPVHNPTNHEVDDSVRFAENVRIKIGAERERMSGVKCPLTKHTINDAKFVQYA